MGQDWVFRDHAEKDYGTDIHIEIFDGNLPTGLILYGQVKGTQNTFPDKVKLNNFPTKTANYANLFDIPFFVFYSSTSEKKTKFVWLQEYLRLKVKPNLLTEQQTITIDFPEENSLNENGLQKIIAILEDEKFRKIGIKFLTYYERLLLNIENLKKGDISSARSCLINFCEIMRLEIVPQLADERDLFSCDFKSGILILNKIIHAKNITESDLKKLEQIIFCFRMKKLQVLNIDTDAATRAWIHYGTCY